MCASLLFMWLTAINLRKQLKRPQAFGTLLPTWDIQVEFLASARTLTIGGSCGTKDSTNGVDTRTLPVSVTLRYVYIKVELKVENELNS